MRRKDAKISRVTRADLRDLFTRAPLVASVQAGEGSPLEEPATLARLAEASIQNGVELLRLQGEANIRAVRDHLPNAPTIGLIKRTYPGSEVYITPTLVEVWALLDLGCEIVALDATNRPRPYGETLPNLLREIQRAGALAMADGDSLASLESAAAMGFDLLSTTLAGYTTATRTSDPNPDLSLVADARASLGEGPILLAEGRYAARWQVESALQAGADAVVVGGALNDPVKQTRALLPRRAPLHEVAAFDLGGTWLRFARYEEGTLKTERAPTPPTRAERLAWMRARIAAHGLTRAAVSSGGTIDPATGEVWESKPMIPEHEGTIFDERTLGVPTVALNDGLATALAHARLPSLAGRRVATLALGTGVGAGFVAEGRLVRGGRGEYPRLNDLPLTGGGTVESALGGAALTPNPSPEAQDRAVEAYRLILSVVRAVLFPDAVIVGGAVGLAPWLAAHLDGAAPTPFGPDAGLAGALTLAEWGS